MTKYHFKDDANIELWIQQEGKGDIDALATHLHLGFISQPRRAYAEAYLAKQQRRKMSAAEQANYELNKRMVEASEDSAKSARWAKWISIASAVIAVASAVIAWLALRRS